MFPIQVEKLDPNPNTQQFRLGKEQSQRQERPHQSIQSIQKLLGNSDDDLFESSIKEEDLNQDSDDFQQFLNKQKSSEDGTLALSESEFQDRMKSYQNRPSAKVITRNQEVKMNSLPQQRSNSEYLAVGSNQRKDLTRDIYYIEQSSSMIRLRPQTKKVTYKFLLILKQEAGQNTIIEEREGKLFDSLREKEIKIENDVKLYSDNFSTEQIYEDNEIEQQLWNSLDGQNCNYSMIQILHLVCIFSFGHTGSGKSHTIFGNKEKSPGLLPLILESMFAYIYQVKISSQDYIQRVDLEFLIRVSYFEIYNEQINDLLSPNTLRTNGSNIDKVTEEACINIDQIISLVRMGDINRQLGTTKNNDRNSKAHVIFRIIVETYCPEASQHQINKINQSVINLVDLGGSEALNEKEDPDRNSQQQREAFFPIKSLITLEQIITILSEGNDMNEWIPYRESKLTRFMQPYLEGNSKMLWICNISPCDQHYRVNKRTIEFANKIPQIKQQVQTNSISPQQSQLHKTKKKIKLLRQSLVAMDNLIQRKGQMSQKNGVSLKPQDFDQEVDEKVRLNNEIKKLTDQILVSEKVAAFMKKFDKMRGSNSRNNPNLQSNQRKSTLYARMSKRIDNARDFVIKNSFEEEKYQNENDTLDPNNRRSSTQRPMIRKTIKSIQKNQSNDNTPKQNFDQPPQFAVGRLTFLDQMMDSQNQRSIVDMQSRFVSINQDMNLLTDDNLLDDNLDELNKTPMALMTQNSDYFERNLNSFRAQIQQFQEQSMSNSKDVSREQRLEKIQNIDDDSLLDDEEIEQDDLEDYGEEQKSQHDRNQDYDDDDVFYAIVEEEDEEDSFEREKREKREKSQLEYELKIDELEKNFGGSFISKRDKTQVSNNGQFDGEEFQFMDEKILGDGDDDEDLLKNFDGIPKQSIIDRLDQHRDSIKPPNLLPLHKQRRDTIASRNQTEVVRPSQNLTTDGTQSGRKTLIRKSVSKKNGSNTNIVTTQINTENLKCSKCQGKIGNQDLMHNIFEADKIFLETLLGQKDKEITEQLKKQEIQFQQSKKEKNDLLTYILELETQLQFKN
ncbi:centromeric protein [Stylonychia lemnae]|uniref:Centromeric protein n=1 Tax=Stylonychia lemnae TaxID=5949 RepID=A0A078A7D7_STYLE|nr:centromeric protein [Stylonychia lemnae]|eukprot:CDW76706.1 centromeric protein [Stylonychia lemnae]